MAKEILQYRCYRLRGGEIDSIAEEPLSRYSSEKKIDKIIIMRYGTFKKKEDIRLPCWSHRAGGDRYYDKIERYIIPEFMYDQSHHGDVSRTLREVERTNEIKSPSNSILYLFTKRLTLGMGAYSSPSLSVSSRSP